RGSVSLGSRSRRPTGSGSRSAGRNPNGSRSSPRSRRVDGRLVIAGIIGIGLVFVFLNLCLARGPGDVRVLTTPTSLRATRGTAYPVRLLSPCAPVIDFDRTFWAPRGGWTLTPPTDPATATLVDSGRAILRLASGQVFRLVRQPVPIRLSRCSSPSS